MATKEQEKKTFRFKQFEIQQDQCPMKVGTDGVLLGAWAGVNGVKTALDIGTGTGLIAIMLAQRAPDAKVHGVDVDKTACEQAAANMEAAPWSGNLKVFHQPVQEFAGEHPQGYDLIVSNPPFFTGGTFSHHQDRQSVRHTTKLPHNDLLRAVRDLLKANGRFAVVLPYIEGLRFQELAEGYNFHCNRMTEVLSKPGRPVERLLMEFSQKQQECKVDTLTISSAGKKQEWTKQYTDLTGEFYLKM